MSFLTFELGQMVDVFVYIRIKCSLELQKEETRMFPLADVAKWSRFVEVLQRKSKAMPAPFEAVQQLVGSYLTGNVSYSILDIGCETGKNTLCLINAGHRVTILDIAPTAIQYTIENIKREGDSRGIVDTIIGRIEDIDSNIGPFQAVVGSYVFSFISPDLFEEVMTEKVLGKVASQGYFAGGFFGPEHTFANNRNMSIMTAAKIESFFSAQGFKIWKMDETKRVEQTVFHGKQPFHTINVIAQRIL